MDKNLIIYHGSHNIIQTPEFGIGNPSNDYGLGFYCTEYLDLAKEWACDQNSSGYANKYTLDMNGLRILDLNSDNFCIIDLNESIFALDIMRGGIKADDPRLQR